MSARDDSDRRLSVSPAPHPLGPGQCFCLAHYPLRYRYCLFTSGTALTVNYARNERRGFSRGCEGNRETDRREEGVVVTTKEV